MTSKYDRVKRKLRSKTGASISFGLFLFLICAVISTTVLVAGTGAAGRMVGMSETEQRYYSVNSTAKMMQQLLEDKTATVIEFDDNKYLVIGKDLKPIEGSIATSIKSMPDYLAYKLSQFNGHGGDFEMDLDLSQIDPEASDVTIKGEADEEERVTFEIDGDEYVLMLKFDTNKKSLPVDIGISGGIQAATKTVYTWDFAGMSKR